MRCCKDCELYECCLRTPLGGCNADDIHIELPSMKYPEPINWDRFRAETARHILDSIIGGSGYNAIGECIKSQVSLAVRYTNELIKQLTDGKE